MKRKTLTFAGFLGAILMAGSALACPTAPATGMSTSGSPVCIAAYGQDGPGTGLQNILSPYNATTNPYGIIVSGPSPNVYTNQIVSALWSIGSAGGSFNQIVLEIAGNQAQNSFGIFDPNNPSNYLQLFSGTASAGYKTTLINNGGGSYTAIYTDAAGNVIGSATATFSTDNTFGYYLFGPDGNFYSMMSLNDTSSAYPNGMPHMVAYQGNGSTVLKIGNATGTWLPNEYIMAWEDTPFASSDLDYNDFVVAVESVTPVPEPAVLGMFSLGLIGILFAVRQRRRKGRKTKQS